MPSDRHYLTDPQYSGLVKRLRSGGFPDETIIDVIKGEEEGGAVTGSSRKSPSMFKGMSEKIPNIEDFVQAFQVPSEEEQAGMRQGYGRPQQGPPAPPGPQGQMMDQYRAAAEQGQYGIPSPMELYEGMRGAMPDTPEFAPPPGFEQPPGYEAIPGPIQPPLTDPFKDRLLDAIFGSSEEPEEEEPPAGPEMMPQDISAQGPGGMPAGPGGVPAGPGGQPALPPGMPPPERQLPGVQEAAVVVGDQTAHGPSRNVFVSENSSGRPDPAPTPLAPAPAPDTANQSALQQFINNPNLMEMGLRLMAASQPGAEHVATGIGPSIFGAVGEAGLGTLASDRARKSTAAKAATAERRHRETVDAEASRHTDKMALESKKLIQNAARIAQDGETKRLLIEIDQEWKKSERQLKLMEMRADVHQDIADLRGDYADRIWEATIADTSEEEKQAKIRSLNAELDTAIASMKSMAGIAPASREAPSSGGITRAEWEELEPGETYLAPDGKMRVKQ